MKKVFRFDESSNLKNAIFVNTIENQKSVLLKTINQELQANIFENIPRTSTFSKHLKQQLNQDIQQPKKVDNQQQIQIKKMRGQIQLPQFDGEVKWPFFRVSTDASIKHFWNRKTQQDMKKKWQYDNYAFQNIMLRIGRKKKNVKGYYFKLTYSGMLMYFKKESDNYPKGYLELSYNNRAILSFQKTKKNIQIPLVYLERADGIGITIFDHQNELTLQFFEALQDFCLMKGYEHIYTEIETLGSGAFATVYKVQRKRDEQIFAAKTITKKMFEENKHQEKFIQMVYNEVIALKSFDHIGIEKIYEVYQEKEKLIIIIEYCDGGTLYQYFKQKGRLVEKNIAYILKGIGDALFELHQNGFVHRDIKLENIMIESKDTLQMKLVDFGFAEQINEDQLLSKAGTPGFLPPEIFKGQPYTQKGDVFSLGVVLYILAAGYPPFRGKPSQIQVLNQKCQINFDKHPWPDLSQDLKLLIKRMLEVKVEDRLLIGEVLDSAFVTHHIKNTSETNYKSYQMLSGLEIEKHNKKNSVKNSESGGSKQSKEFQLDFSVHTNDIKSLYQKNSIKTLKTVQSQRSRRQSVKQSQNLKQSMSAPRKSDIEKYQEKRKQSHPDRSSYQRDSEILNSSFGEIMKQNENYKMRQSINLLTTFIDFQALSQDQKQFIRKSGNIFNKTKIPNL
ncbi:unnamed protein product [Paramecium pentaurelia]|uniref:Protein kinase domain-containing protein n=1 Tax=Paramecium pentaurelia TaxID=43138 RepID=A0A8S1UKQ0_9CILI|nr:unnamed protein product [Paramecium pentaurelia]